jgi:hypothetical protein
MELLLLLAAPLLWLLLLPARVIGRARRLPIRSAGLVGLLVVGGLLISTTARQEPPSVDYAAGDAALRALLD